MFATPRYGGGTVVAAAGGREGRVCVCVWGVGGPYYVAHITHRHHRRCSPYSIYPAEWAASHPMLQMDVTRGKTYRYAPAAEITVPPPLPFTHTHTHTHPSSPTHIFRSPPARVRCMSPARRPSLSTCAAACLEAKGTATCNQTSLPYRKRVIRTARVDAV